MALTKEQLQKKFSARKIILPMLLGLGVIGYMLYQNYDPSQVQTLMQADLLWASIALLVLFIRDFGYMYRIRYITEKALSWKQSFNVIMLWEFASCALPSVVGGTTIAAFMLFKEKIPLGKSIAQVMVTAMLDNLYFVLAVPVVILVAQGQLLPEIAGISDTMRNSIGIAFLVSYLLIAIYAFVMFYALFINPKAVKRLMIRVGHIKLFRRWRVSLFHHANELLIASKHLRTKNTSYWLHASISTFFVWTARYLIIGCLIAAFTHLSFSDHILIFCRNLIYKIVLFVSVTPGGAGFAELAFPAFFGVFIGSFTTIIILLYRLLTYYLYLLAGAIIFPRWAARVFSKDASGNNSDTVTQPDHQLMA